jgi:hypothetical protein
MKRISQSFMVDMRSYMNGGSCGHIIKERWINGNLLEESSKSMNLGAYFEYIFTKDMTGTGSLPKNGQVPMPDLRADYKKAVAEIVAKQLDPKTHNPNQKPYRAWTEADMLAPYQLAHVNSRRLQQYFKEMGIKILKAGRMLAKGKFEGTIDIIAEATKKIIWNNGDIWKEGYQFVIDLKYVGTLEDRWQPYGWGAMKFEGDNEQKKIHGTQALQYNYITDLPFYFMVVSSTNEIDVKFFKIEITQEQSEAHIMEGLDLAEKLKFYNEIGLEPRPDMAKCGECPLKVNCPDKATYPQFEIITL